MILYGFLFPDKIYVTDKEMHPSLLPSPDKQTIGRENDESEAVTKAVLRVF